MDPHHPQGNPSPGTSGETNGSGGQPALDPTTVLQQTFRNAARTVTQLYKESLSHSQNAYARGYEQCLQDLLDALPHFTPVPNPLGGPQGALGMNGRFHEGGRLLSAEEILGYVRSRHDALQNNDGAFAAHTRALFGDAEFTFVPPSPSPHAASQRISRRDATQEGLSPTSLSGSSLSAGQKRPWGVGREEIFFGRNKEDGDGDVEIEQAVKRYHQDHPDSDEEEPPSGRHGGGAGMRG